MGWAGRFRYYVSHAARAKEFRLLPERGEDQGGGRTIPNRETVNFSASSAVCGGAKEIGMRDRFDGILLRSRYVPGLSAVRGIVIFWPIKRSWGFLIIWRLAR